MHPSGRAGLRSDRQVKNGAEERLFRIVRECGTGALSFLQHNRRGGICMTKRQRNLLVKIIAGAVLFAVAVVIKHVVDLHGGGN